MRGRVLILKLLLREFEIPLLITDDLVLPDLTSPMPLAGFATVLELTYDRVVPLFVTEFRVVPAVYAPRETVELLPIIVLADAACLSPKRVLPL